MLEEAHPERTAEEATMPTIDLPQGTVQFAADGPADSAHPPVVFLHGLLVDGQLWREVAAKLADQGVRSYAPDLPIGAHRTALNPDADLSPRGVARLVLDFLAANDLTDVTLVGNDTGGALCQFVIDTDATCIGRLVLTNCDAFDQFPPPPFGLLVKAGRSPRRLRAMMAPMRSTWLRHSTLGFGPLARKLDPAVTRSWVEPLRTDAAVRRDTAKFMRAIDKRDLLDVSTRLGGFTKPVRLVWGAGDRFFKIDFARRLRDIFPDSTLEEVAGARTFLPIDEPDRVVATIVAAARARHSG
jgi:pimeloyl-ACP methyl ester carboxylesterase